MNVPPVLLSYLYMGLLYSPSNNEIHLISYIYFPLLITYHIHCVHYFPLYFLKVMHTRRFEPACYHKNKGSKVNC